MPLDALHLHFAARELQDTILGGRIDKVLAVSHDTVLFVVRSNAQTSLLTISVNPSNPRCYLAKQKPSCMTDNPPRYLLNLKRKLQNGRIKDIRSIHGERILCIVIESKNELGDLCGFMLVAELMGKHSNLILVDDDGKIVECVKMVGADMSSKRQVLPGLSFCSAPAQGKTVADNPHAVRVVLDGFCGGDLARYLLASIAGLAPVTVAELLFRAFGESIPTELAQEHKQRLIAEFEGLVLSESLAPCFTESDFYAQPYRSQSAQATSAGSLHAAMDAFYTARDKKNALTERTTRLTAATKAALARTEKKLGMLRGQLHDASDFGQDRMRGELLTANLYRIKGGEKELTVENYEVDPPTPLTIALDEGLTATQNAQAYFKRYQKKKKTVEMLTPQIEQLAQEVEYLEGIFAMIAASETADDLDEIAEELTAQGVLKRDHKPSKRAKQSQRDGLTGVKRNEFEGYLILTGKNNIQNDALLKSSAPSDVWLHAKDIHGSHTIIVNPKKTMPPDAVLRYAAAVTAHYSKANSSENVPIDYTFAKFVHKPKGSAPGRVVYTNQKTVYTNPVS